jgi:hypothetical protein
LVVAENRRESLGKNRTLGPVGGLIVRASRLP